MSMAPDARLMIEPDPWSTMTRPAAWQPKNTPLKFTAEHAVEVVLRRVEHQAVDDDRGVVHHHVEVSVLGDDRGDQVVDVGRGG